MRLFPVIVMGAAPCMAQFGGVFDQFFGGGAQQHRTQGHAEGPTVNNIVENTYLDMDCPKYLCDDTLACVDTPQDCPCLYPDSQIKCVFPENKGFVCISKPSNDEGPDCEYVLAAYAGKI